MRFIQHCSQHVYYHAKPRPMNTERLELIAMIKKSILLIKAICWSTNDWQGKKLTRYLAGKLMRANGLISHQPVKHRYNTEGSHYTSLAFEKEVKAFAMKHSMSRRGNCYDNDPNERFFRSLKSEWINKTIYADTTEMQHDITDYILGYYRRLRPHTFNKQLTPEKKEQLYYQ